MTHPTDQTVAAQHAGEHDVPAEQHRMMKIAPSVDLDRARTLILISLGFWLLVGVLSTGVQAAIA